MSKINETKWAIYSPMSRALGSVFEDTRKRAILLATGEKDHSKRWKFLYRNGFRAIKVKVNYDF